MKLKTKKKLFKLAAIAIISLCCLGLLSMSLLPILSLL